MRIIAGSARGCALFAPKGMETRPTQDHVRESLFNILVSDVPDARVLDLFAGSGALALEALSRGASEAVLVDRSDDAARTIARNIEKLRFGDRAVLLRADWRAALARMGGRKFDLVFLDPPYRMVETADCCAALADAGLLAPGACVVVEHRRDNAPAPDARFSLRGERAYRETVVHLFTFEEG